MGKMVEHLNQSQPNQVTDHQPHPVMEVELSDRVTNLKDLKRSRNSMKLSSLPCVMEAVLKQLILPCSPLNPISLVGPPPPYAIGDLQCNAMQ